MKIRGNKKVLRKSLIILGLISTGICVTAHADDTQQFYNDGYDLMLEFRKCSTIKNQLGSETTACLNKAELSISSKLKAFELKHKVAIVKLSNPTNNLGNASEFINSQKQNCKNLYPSPLQSSFKNQIKSCQVQVDLNRYMYVANSVLGI